MSVIRTAAGTQFLGGDTELKHLQQQFTNQHYIQFAPFLDEVLLAAADRLIQTNLWGETDYANGKTAFAQIQEFKDSDLNRFFQFLLNDQALFKWMEAITGCPTLGCMSGRPRRMLPEQNQHIDWHNDLGESRLLGLSINLGHTPHEGGDLLIRRKGNTTTSAEVQNKSRGSAVLFRISAELEHSVSALTGTVPRVFFSGWFRQEPDYFSEARNLIANERLKP